MEVGNEWRWGCVEVDNEWRWEVCGGVCSVRLSVSLLLQITNDNDVMSFLLMLRSMS